MYLLLLLIDVIVAREHVEKRVAVEVLDAWDAEWLFAWGR